MVGDYGGRQWKNRSLRFTASRGGADENKQYWYRVPGGLAEGPNTIVRVDTVRSVDMREYEP